MLSLNQCRQNFFKSVISTGDLLLKKVKIFTKRYFLRKKIALNMYHFIQVELLKLILCEHALTTAKHKEGL